MHMYLSKLLLYIPVYLINLITHLANVTVPSYNANNSCGMVNAALRRIKTNFADLRHFCSLIRRTLAFQLSFAVPWHSKATIELDNSSGGLYNVSDDW